jgi:hypothetical protein
MSSQVYKNKVKLIPSIEEVISSLRSFDINFILIGSEVGKIYNLCEFTKDIDLLIDPSTKNFKKLYRYLKQHFNINFKSLCALDRIVLVVKEKTIEIFIRDALFVDYDFNKKNHITEKFFNNIVTILPEEEYINSVKKCIIYHISKQNLESASKYINILNKYNKKYSI